MDSNPRPFDREPSSLTTRPDFRPLVQVFTGLVFDVDVLEFLSAYFTVFSAYLGSFKCIFACIFYTF